MPPSSQETFHGYVDTTHDALLIIHLCNSNILKKVSRRLSPQERKGIRSGSCFVFAEKESGVKRWTDGLVWSPSRVKGNFLVYREMVKVGSRDEEDDDLVGGLTGGTAGRSGFETNANYNKDYVESWIANQTQLGDTLSPFMDVGSPATPYSPQSQAVSPPLAPLKLSTSPPSPPQDRRASDNDEKPVVLRAGGPMSAFKKDGLVKKSFSIVVDGEIVHLISYYKKPDISMLRTPSSVFAAVAIPPSLTNPANFRISIKSRRPKKATSPSALSMSPDCFSTSPRSPSDEDWGGRRGWREERGRSPVWGGIPGGGGSKKRRDPDYTSPNGTRSRDGDTVVEANAFEDRMFGLDIGPSATLDATPMMPTTVAATAPHDHPSAESDHTLVDTSAAIMPSLGTHLTLNNSASLGTNGFWPMTDSGIGMWNAVDHGGTGSAITHDHPSTFGGACGCGVCGNGVNGTQLPLASSNDTQHQYQHQHAHQHLHLSHAGHNRQHQESPPTFIDVNDFLSNPPPLHHSLAPPHFHPFHPSDIWSSSHPQPFPNQTSTTTHSTLTANLPPSTTVAAASTSADLNTLLAGLEGNAGLSWLDDHLFTNGTVDPTASSTMDTNGDVKLAPALLDTALGLSLDVENGIYPDTTSSTHTSFPSTRRPTSLGLQASGSPIRKPPMATSALAAVMVQAGGDW